MKKSAFTLLGLLIATASFSQTLADGIKFIYYGKNRSAITALEKIVADKSKDAQSIYWLGQAYLADYAQHGGDGLTKAKTLYQQSLQGGVNDPWIWVGSGEITLAEGGDANAAKQQFEQAITATKGKKGVENADILNAVGRANAYGDSKHGDPQYGIDVLKRAAAADPKNPDIDINLGINYLKQGSEHGGDAVQAFTDATVRDPKYAAGYYRVGHIYQSQDNKQSMDEWYGKAISADDAYGPVYFGYFDYYKDKDVNAAKDYLDKYVVLADKDCQTSYYQADYLFRAGKYQESLAKADSMAMGACKEFDRINMLYAYDYDRSGDSVKARSYLQKFFSVTTKPEADDYVLAGKVYAKFPGNEDTAAAYLTKAIQVDTVTKNKISYAKIGVDIFAKAKNLRQQLLWLGTANKLSGGDGKLKESEYYKLGNSAIDAVTAAPDSVATMQNYALADSIAKAYVAAYPDKPQPYAILVNAAKAADKDTSHGYAVEPIATANQFYAKDTATTSKNSIFRNDYYLVLYYLNYNKSIAKIEAYKKAVVVLDEMAAVTQPGTEGNTFATTQGTKIKAIIDKFEKAKQGGGGTGAAPAKPAGTKQQK